MSGIQLPQLWCWRCETAKARSANIYDRCGVVYEELTAR
jgi:hypothetical protein